MSLDARFTQLRKSMERTRGPPVPSYQRNQMPRERVSTLKNRLLAMEMAERPHVMAALSRGRPRMRRGSFSAGLGAFAGPVRRSRSPFPRSRSRQRSGSLRRSNSMGRLGRSQSMQSLMSIGGSEDGYGIIGRNRRGGRPGRGSFRTRVFTRGSRITNRGGIRKLNMDLVAIALKRRSASLSRLGNSISRGGFKRGGRGVRGASMSAGNPGIKARLGIAPGPLMRSNSQLNLSVRGLARGGGRGGRGNRGGLQGGQIRQRSNSISRRGGGGGVGRGLQTRGGRGRVNLRGATRGTARGAARGTGRGTSRGNKGNRQLGINRGNLRGRRGGNRGRGGVRGGRGAGKKPTPPSKEDLDNELDLYMSNSRSYLDKQLDQYMAQPAPS